MSKKLKVLVMALILSMIPVTTTFAAIDKEADLVNKAVSEKSFYYYNEAYATLINMQDTAKRDELLGKLSTIGNVVWNPSIKAINMKMEQLAKTASGKVYDEIQVLITKANIPEVDKAYFMGEVNSWGTKLVWTDDYKAAIDAVGKAWITGDTKDALDKFMKVKNKGSQRYISEQITQIELYKSSKGRGLLFLDVMGEMIGNPDTSYATKEKIVFKDANLENAIRKLLNKPTGDITQVDVSKITHLYLHSLNITDLTGLEHFKNLISLNLSGNADIVSLAPILNLTKLNTLLLANVPLTDISDIGNITSLTRLQISSVALIDITPLQNLTNLQDLSLTNLPLVDVNVLQNLTKLKRLNLDLNNITDISALANLTNLQILGLMGNNIEDVSPLTKLTNLNLLLLDENPVKNIDVLTSLPKLKDFHFDGSKIK